MKVKFNRKYIKDFVTYNPIDKMNIFYLESYNTYELVLRGVPIVNFVNYCLYREG